MPSTSERDDRLQIWNSYFKLAWTATKAVFEADGSKTEDNFDTDPAPLPDQEHFILTSVLLTTLAIEARANHLIEDLVEQGKVPATVARAVQWLPTADKWFAIPDLLGGPPLPDDNGPHQSIRQLGSLRNDLMHANYARLGKKLPKRGAVLTCFENFVAAMEDMNVRLGKGGRTEARPAVLRLGRFVAKS